MAWPVAGKPGAFIIDAPDQILTRNRQLVREVIDETADPEFGYSAQAVVLNLAGCTFIDTAGLGMLVSAHNALRAQGKALVLLDPCADLRALLALTKLDTLFTVEVTS